MYSDCTLTMYPYGGGTLIRNQTLKTKLKRITTMALKSKSKETAENTAAQTEENQAPETQQEETKTEQTKEVAVRKTASAPSLVGGATAFINNPDILDAVADASYGTFPSIVASNGTHMVSGGGSVDLGKVLKFQAIVAKPVWKVTPGSNDDEAKDYFSVSSDGETTNQGQPIEEALQDALDAGYSKAAIKEYIDVICIIVDCADEDYIGETMTLQLSPSSQFTWKPLAGRCKMKAAMGKLEAVPVMGDPDLGTAVVFTSTATPTSYKGNSFTKLEFSV